MDNDQSSQASQPAQQQQPVPQSPQPHNEGEKLFVGTLILSYFFGSFGADRFYVGKVGTGVIKLLTLGGLGIWTTYDFIMVVFGKFTDKDGKSLKGYEENKSWAKIIGIIMIAIIVMTLLLFVFPLFFVIFGSLI